MDPTRAMASKLVTPIFDLVLCLSQAVDLVSPLVADHHKRTAQIVFSLGQQLELPEAKLMDVVIAASLHDAGGLTCTDRLNALDFEFTNPYGHSVNGYLLLKPFQPFQNAAEIVRFHHVAWKNGAGAVLDGTPVPLASHLLQLADRVAILIDPKSNVLEQVDGILNQVRAQVGLRFVPQQVAALEILAQKEAFWLDAVYLQYLNSLSRRLHWSELEIDDEQFLGLTNVFRRIVDFRSQFTASHSAGVAATSEHLARLCGFSNADRWLIHLAGLLHDLGKLAVPAEILEKPGKLSKEEYDLVRRHTYYTFHILEPLKILDVVRIWGAYHHESMDGHGYPFHLAAGELPLGSRIVTVADIFTALTENRPYRAGIDAAAALDILIDASAHQRVDAWVVSVLREHLDEMNAVRGAAQISSQEEYRQFVETARHLAYQD